MASPPPHVTFQSAPCIPQCHCMSRPASLRPKRVKTPCHKKMLSIIFHAVQLCIICSQIRHIFYYNKNHMQSTRWFLKNTWPTIVKSNMSFSVPYTPAIRCSDMLSCACGKNFSGAQSNFRLDVVPKAIYNHPYRLQRDWIWTEPMTHLVWRQDGHSKCKNMPKMCSWGTRHNLG